MATLLKVPESEPGQGLYWLDVSSTLHESLPGAKLRAPFISGPSINLYETVELGPEVDLLACDDGNDGNDTKKWEVSLCNNVTYITYQVWTNASGGHFMNSARALGQYDLAESNSFNYPSTKSFDFAFVSDNLAIWVNGTKAYPIGEYDNSGNVVPQVSFPFTRLASINLPEKSCYLNHQINGTTLAEEEYDFSLHEWVTTYITVPNP